MLNLNLTCKKTPQKNTIYNPYNIIIVFFVWSGKNNQSRLNSNRSMLHRASLSAMFSFH
uniref:Uncharacterized protein n=1 Tax=Anguilla anguilla TaxID=7936 RepID=A0A0E9WIZ5_ANGAN